MKSLVAQNPEFPQTCASAGERAGQWRRAAHQSPAIEATDAMENPSEPCDAS